MARLFRPYITRYVDAQDKRCRKDASGARKLKERSKTWRGTYKDCEGLSRTVTLCSNKQASQQMLAEFERKAHLQKSGLISPHEEHLLKPLTDHLQSFIQDLENQGNTQSHCKLLKTRINQLILDCGFKRITDLSAEKVSQALAKLKQKGRSQQTANHYLKAIKQFSRWLVKHRRTQEDRLQFLEGGNVRTDRRIKRRALSETEIQELLQATRHGESFAGLTGEQRFFLYLAALSTGLRASELASLRKCHLQLQAEIPHVVIEARYEKARRGDTIPLSQELVQLLQSYTAKLKPQDLLWPGIWAVQKRTARCIRFDLKQSREDWIQAGSTTAEKKVRLESETLLYINSEGQADFHALRHTFITRLARAGVQAKSLQKLARHSTSELTLGRYTHHQLEDLQAAIEQVSFLQPESVSKFPVPSSQAVDQNAEAAKMVATLVAVSGGNHCENVTGIDDRCTLGGAAPETIPEQSTNKNSPENRAIDNDCESLEKKSKTERQGLSSYWIR
jgi:integrase